MPGSARTCDGAPIRRGRRRSVCWISEVCGAFLGANLSKNPFSAARVDGIFARRDSVHARVSDEGAVTAGKENGAQRVAASRGSLHHERDLFEQRAKSGIVHEKRAARIA